MEMLNEGQDSRHDPGVHRLMGRIGKVEIGSRVGHRHVEIPPLAVDLGQGRAFAGIGHHHEMPILYIGGSGGLLRNGEAFENDLALDWAAEVKPFAHGARCREEFIQSEGKERSHRRPPNMERGACIRLHPLWGKKLLSFYPGWR
jgi:hypothetical protein